MDDLLDLLSNLGHVRARKMFGEYCLYCADKPVALVYDDQLFLTPIHAGRCMIEHPVEVSSTPARSLIC